MIAKAECEAMFAQDRASVLRRVVQSSDLPERIKAITGLGAQKHYELVELLLALDCALA
jgi:hypothetical protein